MNRKFSIIPRLTSFFTLILISILAAGSIALTQTPLPPVSQPPAAGVNTGSAGIATGNPDGPHSRYGWPFPIDQMGHLNSSYQLYSDNYNDAYFHHGIDMIAPDGTEVRTPVSGQVVNVENYRYPSGLYWEVAILDPEGYVWQYHHIAQPSIPTEIRQAFAAYQADPTSGGFVAANTYLGDIVTWTEWSFGAFFHHIHLNILAAGDVYLNPLEFLDDTYIDTQAPQVQSVGLFTGTNTLLTGNTIPYGTEYSIYLQARDLFMSEVYHLPPHRVTYTINDNPDTHTVWDFHTLPGGSSETGYVNNYFLPGLTRGNYDERVFYIDLGFSKDGSNPLPTEPGAYEINVDVWDFAYNRATWKYRWVITQALPDNGCATNQGVRKIYTVDEHTYVEDITLGLVLAHEKRGEVRVTLTGPMDNTPVVLIPNSADGNLNYNILIDDSSTDPINNNNKRDDLYPPYYKRVIGPAADGSLDQYYGLSAEGPWEVFICDNKPGIAGILYDMELRLVTTDNLKPVAYDQAVYMAKGQSIAVTLAGSDPEAAELSFEVVTPPFHGVLYGSAPDLVYTPNENFWGTDSFTFLVNDGELDSIPATVTIFVIPAVYLPVISSMR